MMSGGKFIGDFKTDTFGVDFLPVNIGPRPYRDMISREYLHRSRP